MSATEILSGAAFVALRYEGRYTDCTGITAVAKQEQRVFAGRGGVMVHPWCPQMASARSALSQGKVSDTGIELHVPVNSSTVVLVRVLIAQERGLAPQFFLAADGFFQGVESPYDTRDLNRDALFFGLAVKSLLAGRISHRAWIWAADWQTSPALALLQGRHLTAITLHNTFDSFLGPQASFFADLRFNVFTRRTALQVAMDVADVVTTVNRGYAYGLGHEVFHTRVMANHLQERIDRIVGIDNANFVEPAAEHRDLAAVLESDLHRGVDKLNRVRADARRQLPAELAQRVGDKVLCVSMGRRSSQKLHDAVVESVREVLLRDPSLPLFVFFATTHGDAGSPARLDRIVRLCQEFPANCGWSDGRVPYFPHLMAAGSYNLLCSLWAPHEGAFEATIVPIARAVDGLAAQVIPVSRSGLAGAIADRWHAAHAAPNGITFREDAPPSYENDLRELLEQSPSPHNATFAGLVAGLAQAMEYAIRLSIDQPLTYAALVRGAIQQQMMRSWEINFGGMLALVEQARTRREP